MDNQTQKKYIVKQNFSLKKEILKYLVHWKWFVSSVILFILIAIIFLKVTVPVFNNKTTILIKESEEGRGSSELAAFKDFNLFEGGNDKDDEVEIIGSKYLIARSVDSLDLNITQKAKIGFRTIDIYDISPINVTFKWGEIGYRQEIEQLNKIEISLVSDTQFNLINEELEGTYSFNTPIKFEQGELMVSKSVFFDENKKLKKTNFLAPIEEIMVYVFPKEYYISELQKNISVTLKNKRSSVLDVSIEHSNKVKANAFLDNLIYQYNKDAMKDVNLIARSTDDFINKRLAILTKELDSVEKKKVLFKKTNKLTDVKSESEIFIQENSDSKKKLFEIETQLSITKSIADYLISNDKKQDLVPVNIGLENSGINSSISDYNKVVLQRNKLLSEDATEYNPFVVSLGNDIKSQKNNLLNALKKQIENLKITKNNFEKEKAQIESKIRSIPKTEKEYLSIVRQQIIKENLYIFLLSRREENSISMSVTSPVAKVIEQSTSSNQPIFPKPLVILLLAIVGGLVLPFGIIYIKDLLDTKVITIEDIKNVLRDIPVLGETIELSKKDSHIIGKNDRSVLAESFRIIRMNLDFFVRNKRQGNKAVKVFVTSSVKGEGKTFVSINTLLSLVDAKTNALIIGADIRNPKLNRYFNDKETQIGLVDYLSMPDITPSELVRTVTLEDRTFDYIEAGRVPPNPSELLMNGRLDDLLNELENNYDYIILDTAPVALVADTLLIANSADLLLYVLRSEFTEKDHLHYIKSIYNEGKVKNLALVLNGVRLSKSGYGYGYGYMREKGKWYQKFLS